MQACQEVTPADFAAYMQFHYRNLEVEGSFWSNLVGMYTPAVSLVTGGDPFRAMILLFSTWGKWDCRITEGHKMQRIHHTTSINYITCCLTQTTMQFGITTPSSWGNFFMRLMHPSLWALQFAVQSSIHPRASWRWKKPWTPCRVQPHGRKVKHEWRFTCCRIWQNSWIGCMRWNVEIILKYVEPLLSWKDCEIRLVISLPCVISVKRVAYKCVCSHPKSIPMINWLYVLQVFCMFAEAEAACAQINTLMAIGAPQAMNFALNASTTVSFTSQVLRHELGAFCAWGMLVDFFDLLRFGWLWEIACFIQYLICLTLPLCASVGLLCLFLHVYPFFISL